MLERLDSSPFGLNSHVAPPKYLHKFADIGLRWHRIDIDWDRIETEEGKYDWSEVDAVVGAASERSLSLLGVIAYTPAWAAVDPNEPAKTSRTKMPSDPSRYLAFVEAVVARYGGDFKALSVWNEPNLKEFYTGTRSDYISRLLVPALETIRANAPQIVRVGPDLSSSPGGKPHQWLGEILDQAGDLLDVISHHQYDGRDTSQGRAAELVKLHDFITRKGFGDRPIWVTETGWHVKRDAQQVGPLARQARLLTEMMAEMRQRKDWWSKTFWYDSHGPEFGLLVGGGDPREGDAYPAFESYAATIASTAALGGAQSG